MGESKFPTSPGLYIVQRETNVILLKITGMYPTLQLGKAISIDKIIEGNSIKEASKEIVTNISLFPEKWKFTKLDCINMNAFPKQSFRPDGYLDLSTEEYLSMRSMYYRLSQSGISFQKIASAFVFEYKTTMDQVIKLINKFDSEAKYVID